MNPLHLLESDLHRATLDGGPSDGERVLVGEMVEVIQVSTESAYVRVRRDRFQWAQLGMEPELWFVGFILRATLRRPLALVPAA